MAKADETKKYTMLKGTDGGYDYLLVAVRGGIGLGLKPNMIASGSKPGTTYVGARIRSANLKPSDMPQSTGNVIPLGQKQTLDTAWPKITWEKVDSVRASTPIGVFVNGTVEKNPVILYEELTKKDLPRNMAKYVASLAGADNMVISEDDLTKWIESKYAPAVEKLMKVAEAEKKMADEISESIGVFGMQADMMKKVYGSLVPDIEEESEEEDEDDNTFCANCGVAVAEDDEECPECGAHLGD